MNDDDKYYKALELCGQRYKAMCGLTTEEKFKNFVDKFIQGVENKAPIRKLCRWLGYIQGILIERFYTTSDIERDWTRPLFRPLDFPED